MRVCLFSRGGGRWEGEGEKWGGGGSRDRGGDGARSGAAWAQVWARVKSLFSLESCCFWAEASFFLVKLIKNCQKQRFILLPPSSFRSQKVKKRLKLSSYNLLNVCVWGRNVLRDRFFKHLKFQLCYDATFFKITSHIFLQYTVFVASFAKFWRPQLIAIWMLMT